MEKKSYNLKGVKLLITEDEADNYKLLSSILQPYEPEIFWAKNGKEALDFIKSSDMTENIIILMDIKMPVMDGYEANREIKKMNNKVPVIAVTAYAHDSDRQKMEQEKFDDYISKPIKPNVLLDVISRHIRNNANND